MAHSTTPTLAIRASVESASRRSVSWPNLSMVDMSFFCEPASICRTSTSILSCKREAISNVDGVTVVPRHTLSLPFRMVALKDAFNAARSALSLSI